MRRLFAALLPLLCVVPLASARAASDAPTGTLVVKAPRHAKVAVTLRHAVTFWLADRGDEYGPVVEGSSLHTGFLLVPATRAVATIGWVRVPGAPNTRIELVAGNNDHPTVPAGRYTLEVVGERPVTITMRVRGLPNTTWSATAPLTVRRAAATFDSTVGHNLPGHASVTLTATSAVFTVALWRSTGNAISASWCLGHSACGGGPPKQATAGSFLPPVVDKVSGVWFYLAPRTPRSAGSWTSLWTLDSNVLARDPSAYALVIG
ncbi:MAG TPA: hypothetical protein VFQ85_08280 [Mycobacteriales bacterium]|jgi:hypothetical protein|nr:hypothetical protein [Mycobacteriales bacterium]